jgi:signal transduction histidine kinase
MSYELRAPLTAILGILEVMYIQGAEPLSPKQRHYVELIETSSRQLLEMINDILDLTRIGRHREELSVEKIILSEICRSSLMYVQQAANKKRIQLQYDLDPSLGYAYADPIRLKQILTNLLSNGVRFTPRGGMVGVRVKPSEDGRWIDFCVWDTGVGMSEELQERAFQPFVQQDSEASDTDGKSAGAGLGLALVAQLTSLHGGLVRIDSAPGQGTSVTVSLPRERNPFAAPHPDADTCAPDEAVMRR